jgi:hypothetical protein
MELGAIPHDLSFQFSCRSIRGMSSPLHWHAMWIAVMTRGILIIPQLVYFCTQPTMTLTFNDFVLHVVRKVWNDRF